MSKTSPGMRRVVVALLEESQNTKEAAQESGGPAVAAYETAASHKLIKMLEDIEKKFKKELDAVEEAETNSKKCLRVGDASLD